MCNMGLCRLGSLCSVSKFLIGPMFLFSVLFHGVISMPSYRSAAVSSNSGQSSCT